MLEELLTAGQAARVLGLKKKTIYTWAENGYLPAYRIGKALRFRESDLNKFIEENRVRLTRAGEGRKIPQNILSTESS